MLTNQSLNEVRLHILQMLMNVLLGKTTVTPMQSVTILWVHSRARVKKLTKAMGGNAKVRAASRQHFPCITCKIQLDGVEV